jgi:protein-tyrosine-phosphatase
MTTIRRKPGALVTTLRSAARVLIVCHGNIIRSPFAAALVARYVANGGAVSISSAGLAAVPGKPPHPTALQLAAARGVDLSAHAASRLDANVVAESDAIFVMDVPQLLLMRQRFPEARAKTFLLACLASDTPLEIRDPYGGDEARFQACFAHISSAVQPLVHAIASAQVHP